VYTTTAKRPADEIERKGPVTRSMRYCCIIVYEYEYFVVPLSSTAGGGSSDRARNIKADAERIFVCDSLADGRHAVDYYRPVNARARVV